MRFSVLPDRGIGVRTGLMLVLLQLACGPALAQQIAVAPGELTNYERVRVRGEHLSPPRLSGPVIQADRRGQAIFQVDGAERTVDLLHADQIQVLMGWQRVRGALIGANIGIWGTGIACYVLSDSDDFSRLFPELERVFRSLEVALIGGAIGAGINGSP